MKEFYSSYKPVIITVVIIIVIGLAIFFWGKKRGKEKAQGPQASYPKGAINIPKDWNAEPLAIELHDVMSGLFTLTGTKDAAWNKLNQLGTDDMVVAVYNAFNQKYYDEKKETLTDWIKKEDYYDYFSGVKDKTLALLARLNCQ